MKAIILDGYFAGLITNTDGNPDLKLPRPHSFTECNCYDDGSEILHEMPNSYVQYKLAARGYDDSAIYTLSGNLFDPMTKSREWVVDERKRPFHAKSPIYINCRDDNAWSDQ